MYVFLSVSLLPLIIPTICGYLSLAHSLSILVVLKFYANSQQIKGKNSVDMMPIINPTDFEEKECNLAHSSIICNVWITLTFLLMPFFPNYLLYPNRIIVDYFEVTWTQHIKIETLYFSIPFFIIYPFLCIYTGTELQRLWTIFNYFSGLLYLIVTRILIYLPFFHFNGTALAIPFSPLD